ncbi:aldo/keto reductase [Virgisporangium ochraceum]|uniref:dTDP-4-keto-L-6-deoxy-hexose 2,3-reductase n=1 Tax=Virgisporangium ochraceum TaxID=65505 RepID=A0A8J3ZSK7_9ACTN|nr:aldo/keto reductase [Virgisporangium ochraceum]GIJ67605.1 dTDP-4-keto-L-6-deoxy-hexose 2,3-reductase [Virgisporangium ochraceum]
METRTFGRLGSVSALTLGGGGIGQVWGSTDRAEAVATVHAAIDAGITHLDLAPSYGDDFESERVVGDARPPADILVTTKVQLPERRIDDPVAEMRRSLRASLSRIGRDHLDLYLLHTQLDPDDRSVSAPDNVSWSRYRDVIVPEFERMRAAGSIRAWGITGVGVPRQVLDAVTTDPKPDAAQVVVNALDMSGDMWPYGAADEPRNPEIVSAAAGAGVSVIAIRAVAAGSLTASVDRPLETAHPAARDFARAEPFRKLAAELGQPAAVLAHRYALSVPGVTTVVLGVKNRAELDECVAAAERGPLSAEELAAVDALRG